MVLVSEFSWEAEAARYDASRGGEPRAAAAAAAVESLLPDRVHRLLDVGGGTGIVSCRLARPDRAVLVADLSPAMLRQAAARLPGRAVLARGEQLPFREAAFDAVSCVWLLHLVPDAEPLLAEFARLLRPGGTVVCTVDKDAGHHVGSDLDAALGDAAPRRGNAAAAAETDHRARVLALGDRHGLEPAGETRFTAPGRGRSPASVAAAVRTNRYHFWTHRLPDGERGALLDRLGALPDQDLLRPDPVFTVQALRRR